MSDQHRGPEAPQTNRVGVAPGTGPILNDDDLDPGREDVARIDSGIDSGTAGGATDDEAAEEQRIAQRLVAGLNNDQDGSTT